MRKLVRRVLAWSTLALVLAGCHDGPTAPRPGTLVVGIDGLPMGELGQVTISGPNGFSKFVGSTTTFEGLTPGRYTLTPTNVRAAGTTFEGTGERLVSVVSRRRDSTLVHYVPITGSIAVLVSAPPRVAAFIRITGPNGYDRTLSSSQTITDLVPGEYQVKTDTVSGNGFRYASAPATQTLTVQASTQPTNLVVTITAISGALSVTVNGLPNGTGGDLARVEGPDGFVRTLQGSLSLTDIVPGRYRLTTVRQTIDNVLFDAPSTPIDLDVTAGVTSSTSLNFIPVSSDGSPLLNYRVQQVTLTQIVQRADNTVPLVAGRGGLLRVFVTASINSSVRPALRVRYWRNGVLTDSTTIAAAAGTVPLNISATALTGTYDVAVPGALIQPGVSVQVEVDPDHTSGEATRLDNRYPADAPAPLDVRAGPVPTIRLVPIFQSVNALTGDVSEARKAEYLGFLKRVYPIADYDADVRATYTTTAPALQPGDTNHAWTTILSEIEALRVADASTRFYYGVAKLSYVSGIVGLGYIGGRSAFGWDDGRPESGLGVPLFATVLAHELGHNFNRRHSPGCGASGVDPSYPNASGVIGAIGWDSVTNSLKDVTTPDLMGYCHPEWISDYTYTNVLSYLSAIMPAATAFNLAPPERCLIVWGRIENGVPVLEPSFETNTRPVLPSRAGAHVLRALGAGREVLSFSFDAQEVADLPDAQSFAFAIPLSSLGGRAPDELRLDARGREVRRVRTPAALSATDPQQRLQRVNARAAALRWNAARYPLAVVRDARTREILAFARGGDVRVAVPRPDLELVFSDGVRSVTRSVTVAP